MSVPPGPVMGESSGISGETPGPACWAVVPAAGRGRRFGGDVPKQYRTLAGRTVIEWALAPLLEHPGIRRVVVVLAPDDAHWPRLGVSGHEGVVTVRGGDARADSVMNALEWLASRAAPDDRVLVHDAARPCLGREDLDRLIREGVPEPDGALLAAPVADTLKRDDGRGHVAETLARDHVWRALTPQLFPIGALRRALRQPGPAAAGVTDEAMAMELAGFRPRLVAGDPGNIKITSQADLAVAERLLARNPKSARTARR